MQSRKLPDVLSPHNNEPVSQFAVGRGGDIHLHLGSWQKLFGKTTAINVRV